jgi:chromosome segregation ATPase
VRPRRPSLGAFHREELGWAAWFYFQDEFLDFQALIYYTRESLPLLVYKFSLESIAMASKKELQAILKDRYSVNIGISEVLTVIECQRLMTLLDSEPSAVKLVESFVDKNIDLGNRSRQFGKQREQAQKRFETAQAEYAALHQIEGSNQALEQRKQELEKEAALAMQNLERSRANLEQQKLHLEQASQVLEAEVSALQTKTQKLEGQVKILNSEKKELVDVNDDLKKDNKRLKNLFDAIRLNFSREMRQVLKTEDSELRKAIAKLYKSMLG